MMAKTTVSDRALLRAVRRGDRDAYGALWARHAEAIRVAAGFFTTLDADDITAETFARILRSIDRGYGPGDTFRAYALVTARNVAAEWGRGAREVPLDAVADVEDPTLAEFAAAVADDRSLAMKAFHSLPDRWQEVLWYSEVEQMRPAEIAPILGMSANSVAALAVRAREGLKQGWIAAHVRSESVSDEHKWVIERAAKYARNKLSPPSRRAVDEHLEECPNCRLAYAEIEQASGRIALVLLPVVLGSAATGYAGWIASRPHPTSPSPIARGRLVTRASITGGAALALISAVAVGATGQPSGPAATGADSPRSSQSTQQDATAPRPKVDKVPVPAKARAAAPPSTVTSAQSPTDSSAGIGEPGVAPNQSSAPPAERPSVGLRQRPQPTPQPPSTPTPAPDTLEAPPPPRLTAVQEADYLVPSLAGTAKPGATLKTTWTSGDTVHRFTTTAAADGSWAQPAPDLAAPDTFLVTATQTAKDQGRALTSSPAQITVTVTDELTVYYRLVGDQYNFDLVGLPRMVVEVVDSVGTSTTITLDDAGRALVTSPSHSLEHTPAVVMLRYRVGVAHGISQDLSFLLTQ